MSRRPSVARGAEAGMPANMSADMPADHALGASPDAQTVVVVPVSGPVFVDTSVLIQSEDGAHPERRAQVMRWLQVLWQQRLGRVSSQVLNEFYRTITSRIDPPMPNGDARAEVRRYQRWAPWAIDHATVESAWSLESRFNLPYADALIVAAAKVQGCDLLLSLTLPHQQLYDSVTILNPLRAQPADAARAERSA